MIRNLMKAITLKRSLILFMILFILKEYSYLYYFIFDKMYLLD